MRSRRNLQSKSGGDAEKARPSRRRRLLTPARDALAAGALFSLISAPMLCHPTSASPHGAAAISAIERPTPLMAKALADDDIAPYVRIATSSAPGAPDTIYKRTSAQAAWLLLSFAFSLLAALNLATVRHLRQVYARPIKRVRQQTVARRVLP